MFPSHVFKCRRNPGQHISRVSERDQLWIDLGLGRGNPSQKKKRRKEPQSINNVAAEMGNNKDGKVALLTMCQI